MALMRLERPSALTAEHLGVHVEGTEAGGLIDGGLSDFLHCTEAVPEPVAFSALGIVALVVVTECPLLEPRPDAHTHLWLGGQHQVLSEAGGRVAVATSIDPTTGLPLPGETP